MPYDFAGELALDENGPAAEGPTTESDSIRGAELHT